MANAGRGRRRTGWLLALGTYALLVATDPLFHHDVSCHLKSPTHCQACTSSPSASKVERGIGVDALRLTYTGLVHAAAETSP